MLGRNPQEFIKNSSTDSLLIDCLKSYKFYDFDIIKHFFRLDISCQYILEVVHQLKDTIEKYPSGTRIGIIVGASNGPVNVQKRFYESYARGREASSILFKMTPNSIYSGMIALIYGLHSYNTTIYTGSTAALDAINLSISLLEAQWIDAALVACVESRTEKFMPGAAAVLIDSCYRNSIGIEIIQGEQVHLFTRKDVEKYLKGNDMVHSSDAILCDMQSINMVNRIEVAEKKEIYCIEKRGKQYGAVCGLLQIMTLMETQYKKCFLLNGNDGQYTSLAVG
jgi:hypothetical protein